MKRPARPDPTRGARAPGKPPFDRRRYVLLSLALAALDGEVLQVTLARLAEAVRELSLEEPELAPFDPDQSHERHAFVDVVRLLCELGVLVLEDGDDERYARSREGDALYGVGERLLPHLLAAQRPPALSATPAEMVEEQRGDTEEGERTRARHAVFRRLLDDPVLYLDELDERARHWLLHGSGHLYDRLREAGLSVERREEGIAAIDPAGTLTDTPFPEGSSTVKHAALLLCEGLVERARGREGPLPWPELVARVTALQAEQAGRWAKRYDGDAEALARDAVRVLVGFGLAARDGEQDDAPVFARPAAARFAPVEDRR
jgi:uncharacterized protein (TIGR02678 family)